MWDLQRTRFEMRSFPLVAVPPKALLTLSFTPFSGSPSPSESSSVSASGSTARCTPGQAFSTQEEGTLRKV